jgi:hypothetical protein
MANRIIRGTTSYASAGNRTNLFAMKRNVFISPALLLVALSILRSVVATRLDGFTIDEAYHIAAGVSYVKYHDFRINPEHRLL